MTDRPVGRNADGSSARAWSSQRKRNSRALSAPLRGGIAEVYSLKRSVHTDGYTGFMRIGLISDTHGHLGRDAVAVLAGCDQVVHAGDVGPGVLEALSRLAPVVAVRGNNDKDGPESSLPESVSIELGGRKFLVVHRLMDAPQGEWDVVVFGHSHRRQVDQSGPQIRINPGSAGVRGFHDRRSVAVLDIGDQVDYEFIDLGPRSGR